MGVPTRFPAGLSTQPVNYNLGNYPNPDPTKVYTHFNDFPQYTAANWTVETGANAGTAAAAAGQGGVVTLTTAAVGAADYENIRWVNQDFNFSSAQEVWFSTRLKVSEVTASIVLAGLVAAAPGATETPTGGIYFKKSAGAATVDLVLTKASSSTTLSAVTTLTANTYVTLGFYYNGKDTVTVFVNGAPVGSQTTLTNLPTATALSHGVGVVSGEAVAKTLTVDWLLSSQARDA